MTVLVVLSSLILVALIILIYKLTQVIDLVEVVNDNINHFYDDFEEFKTEEGDSFNVGDESLNVRKE